MDSIFDRKVPMCSGQYAKRRELAPFVALIVGSSGDLYFSTCTTQGSNATAYDFYKKNSRWSEGLISAAKQVGWGATVLV